jgi:hypothetical protein
LHGNAGLRSPAVAAGPAEGCPGEVLDGHPVGAGGWKTS